MTSYIRKAASIILILLVLFFTTISILAIWDFIHVDRIFGKTLGTLLVIFIASAIMLFIFAVLYKNEDGTSDNQSQGNNNPPNNPSN